MTTLPAKGQITYERIKQMAKELGCPSEDLLALARKNDPFFRGSPADHDKAEWFCTTWEQGGFQSGAHLRRLHYWCDSQSDFRHVDGKVYSNTIASWNRLCEAAKYARYMKLIPIEWITDHKNPEPTIHATYDSSQPGFEVYSPPIESPHVRIYGPSASSQQAYHLEVWIEKTTMDDVLEPLCEQYGANLIRGEGEMSMPSVHELVGRIADADRPTRIFYISDFDPAGQSMPKAVARKLEWMLQNLDIPGVADLDVRLCPLALTLDQINEYELPRKPIKESEARAATFEKRHGTGAVELDALEALHPGVLGQIVRSAFDAFYSQEIENERRARHSQLRDAIDAQVETITSKYADEIAALEPMREELAAIEIPYLDGYQPQQAQADADDSAFHWLYDSRRSYLDQIAAYKNGKGGGSDE